MWGLAAKLALSPAGKAVGALLAAAAVSGAIYLVGHADGRQRVLDRLASDRVQVFKDGKEIDAKILVGGDDYLCAVLGGCVLPVDAAGD
ncbi:MAG: hypothetical protein ABJG86_11050 [Nitratireductor sp.]